MAGNLQNGPVILYDGVCGLCNRFVQFVLRHDRQQKFRFAALQGQFAHAVVERHAAGARVLRTVYAIAVENDRERLLAKSDAALFVLRELGGVWRFVAVLASVFPRALRDWAYDWIAAHRYRIFGRFDACPLPAPEVRSRFLDLS